MKELQRRQKIRQLLYSWPSVIILAVLTFYLLKGAVLIMRVERESAHKVSSLEAQSAELNMRESKLEEDINKLRTKEGIEEEIKEKWSVVRDGEHVAIIVDERATTTRTGEEDKIWIKKVWDAIMR